MTKTTKNIIYAYGYARVSTDEQSKKGFSIEEQIEEIRRHCELYGIVLVKVFVDEGYSAGNVKRPDFQDMLTELSKKENKVHMIIARDSSRIIRNLILKRSIKTLCDKFDVKLVYLNNDVDDSTPEGNLHSDFVSLLDESELKRVSPRTLKGLRGSALMGNYPYGGPRPPRGYKRVFNEKVGKGFKIIPDKEEAPIIKEIFETLASNRMSGEQMIKYLRKNKIFGNIWTRDGLDKIIDNPIYYGRLKTNYFDSEEKNIEDHYKQYWYSPDCHTEPIITKELWLMAQRAYHHYKKAAKHKYIFSRLVYCTDTDEFMSNEPAWKKTKNGKVLYHYYSSKTLNKRINENKIVERFANYYSIDVLSDINKNVYNNLNDTIINKSKRRDILNEDFDNGLIDEDDYRVQLKNINISIKETKLKLKNLQVQSEKFEDFPFDKKRAIVLSHVKRVNISFKNDIISFDFIDN